MAVLDNLQRTTAARPRTGLLFLAVVVGHVILISSQVQSRSGVPVLEGVTFGAFARVQQGTSTAFKSVRNFWGNYVDLRGARAENAALRSRVADLEVRLQEQRALAQRSGQLQALLDLREFISVPTLAADVISGYVNPGVLTVTIDKGSSDGVKPNMAVISAAGVIGRVIGPLAAHAARVQLLIDHNGPAAAGAMTERTRAGGMVVGKEGDPPLRMDFVSNLADVKPGDVVVTSGADGIYPRGFRIGSVEHSERGEGLSLTITVRPSVDFRALDEVLVVLREARGAISEGASEPGGQAR
ncbi:MAG TPA: rod shape-determining protein MreC [Vicinamibacterales bacterium]|nr:rod shape-determining protein MreC [Vicinamibacterales bacterium]